MENFTNFKPLILIPARGGSKGVKNKNIRIVGGKPLINWTIDVAIKSELTPYIAVSSDSENILEHAHKPVFKIKRPAKISEDHTPMIEVLLHAVNFFKDKNIFFKEIILLQPTCPLRSVDDLINAFSLYFKSTCDSLISVSKVEDMHPARMYEIKDGFLSSLGKKDSKKNRQDLPDLYHRNGSIYISDIQLILKKNLIWGDKAIAFLMPRERSCNIDDEFDLKVANLLLKSLNKKN